MNTENTVERRRITVRMDEELHSKISRRSFEEDKSMNEIMEKAIAEYFKRIEKEEK